MRSKIITEDLVRITDTDLPWDDLSGKTVLVTGACGMIPAYMVETLLFLNERYHTCVHVLAQVRDNGKIRDRLDYYKDNDFLEFTYQNISIPLVFSNIDYIIHGASPASPKFCADHPIQTIDPNVLGTYNLLSLAAYQDADFLFMSSGEAENHFDTMGERAVYGESKRMAETMCSAFYRELGVRAKIARISHTYGPGMNLGGGRVFEDFVADIFFGRNIILKTDGSAIRPFCYLADTVAGLFTIMLKGKNATIYNVGGDDSNTISMWDLAVKLRNMYPKHGMGIIARTDTKPENVLGGKIDLFLMDQLDWTPSTSIEEGFRRTLKYLEEYAPRTESFEGGENTGKAKD